MVEYKRGNLLEADAEALVNTVNCVGVMGKGIALQFKQAFPQNYEEYRKVCKAEQLEPGKVLVHRTGLFGNPRFIINFPTKRHWRGKSRIEDVRSGLAALIDTVQRLEIKSIAVPPLGCGYGGLEWTEVRPLIEDAFRSVPGVRVLVFEPTGAPRPAERPVRTSKPKLTRARALYLLVIARYAAIDFKRTLLEIQKLAYFMQCAGEPLRLQFKAGPYGPYADNLNKVLETLEGHYTTGYEGSRKPDREIELRPGAMEQARGFLGADPDVEHFMGRVSRLIDGFETPYGMELLATVHWVATQGDRPATDVETASQHVQQWNTRKQRLFTPPHVEAAWQRLLDEGWLPGTVTATHR